jgi:hypothetical protein
MKRRDFITLFGGAAAARPMAARGEQPALPVVGYFYPGLQDADFLTPAFRKGLADRPPPSARYLTPQQERKSISGRRDQAARDQSESALGERTCS